MIDVPHPTVAHIVWLTNVAACSDPSFERFRSRTRTLRPGRDLLVAIVIERSPIGQDSVGVAAPLHHHVTVALSVIGVMSTVDRFGYLQCMRTWLIGVTSGVLCASLGFLIALGLAYHPEPAMALSCPQPPKVVSRPMFRPSVLPRQPESPSGCEDEHFETTLCRGQLDACRQAHQSVRQPWPEDVQAESPEAWSRAVDEALAQCELGAELEFIECSEYPCTAALRPTRRIETDKDHEAEMKRLMSAARSCQPLQDVYGAPPGSDESIDVFRLDATCGETRENFFVLMALDPNGPAYELLHTDERTDTQERDLNRWIYRRADDLAAKWPCDGQAG